MSYKASIEPLLVGKQTRIATVEFIVAVPEEVGNKSMPRSSYTILGYIPKGFCIVQQKHLLIYVHCCSIHKRQKFKIAYLSANR